MNREQALEHVLRAALDWLDSHPDKRVKSFVEGARLALDGTEPEYDPHDDCGTAHVCDCHP